MELIQFCESMRILRQQLESLQGTPESVGARIAIHRVLVAPVYAVRANPSENIAAMDGIAVHSDNLSELSDENFWHRVNTGEPVPPQFNSVVKIEDVRWIDGVPKIQNPIAPQLNIRQRGEDFLSGELLLPAGQRLRPADLSMLLAAGVQNVSVFRKPVVSFLPTGSELTLDPAENFKVLESNSAMIQGMVEEWGGIFRLETPCSDDPDALSLAIKTAVQHSDVLVVNAGTSMGTRDLTAKTLETLGTVYFHGVALIPAKPVLFSRIGDVPVLALPGYPAAAFVASYLYLRSIVCSLSGQEPVQRQEVLISSEDIPERAVDSFYRVQCFEVDGRIYVRRILKGAGSVRSLSQMDGLMHVPPNTQIKRRDAVRVDLFQERAETAIAIDGSAHPALFKLFDLFSATMPSHRILFWEIDPEKALDHIIERHTHMAVIVSSRSRDLFPEFANNLRDTMVRYRLFTLNASFNNKNSGEEEHYDLVVSDIHRSHPGIRNLIDCLLSSRYSEWLATQNDIRPATRGLLEESFDSREPS